MKPIILKTNILKVNKILQFSDVHIRLNSRHEEYRKVFEKLYAAIQSLPEDSIVVCCGDVFHQKVNLSPESISLASELFTKIASIKPLIVIPGNHDALLTNRNRLDSLTPVIENIGSTNIYYVKDSGLYAFGDILFNHFSAFDDSEKYILDKDIPSSLKAKYSKIIGLYHGPVSGMKTALGHEIKDIRVKAEMFDGQSFALLGDIHLKQDVFIYDSNKGEYKKYPIIRQAGSVTQQDFGETVDGHGYSIWDVKTNSYEHFDIPNDFAQITLNVKDGEIKESIDSLPKTPKIRIFYSNTSPTQLKEIYIKIGEKCSPPEIISYKLNTEELVGDKDSKKLGVDDLSDLETQKDLLRKYFKDIPEVTEEVLEEIFNIHQLTLSKIGDVQLSKEVNWEPKKLKFSNMFSYGENNEIDYDKMNGIIGIFGKNAAGKSTTNYVLSFCLFDKCPVATEAGDIMNSSTKKMEARFDFTIGDQKYYIEKRSEKDKKGNCPVKINFKKVVSETEVIDLEGENRAGTNENIRKMVGNYDDFLLTTLSILGSKAKNLIEMGQSERKELLGRFTGLDIFDKLNKIAKEDAKEVLTKVKLLNRSAIETEISSYKEEISTREGKELEDSKKRLDIQSRLDDLSEKILELSKTMKKIDLVETNEEVLLSGIEEIKNNKSSKQRLIEESVRTIAGLESQIKEKESKKAELEAQKIPIVEEGKRIDIEKLKSRQVEEDSKKKKLDSIRLDIEKLKSSVRNKLEKLKHLENHKYDPNCKFCVDNEFVKDALKAKTELESDKLSVKELLETEKAIVESLDSTLKDDFDKYLHVKNKYTTLISSINSVSDEISKLQKQISDTQTKIASVNISEYDIKIEKIKNQIEKLKENQQTITENKKIENYIKNLTVEKNSIVSEINQHDRLSKENSVRLNTVKSLLELTNKKIEDVKNVEKQALAYTNYLKSTHKDGISFKLLGEILPKIEDETNEILSKIVDFRVSLKANDGDIDIRICYGDKNWKIELTSGMERFISSIALRVSLINVSRIPKPSFIVIDEGFGALDPEKLGVMSALFDYLKTQFKFVLVISHLDSIKDYVDDIIDITKEDGFSQVKY